MAEAYSKAVCVMGTYSLTLRFYLIVCLSVKVYLILSYVRHSNIQVMKQQLQELWVEGSRLILVPGTTGEIAKVKCILNHLFS